MYEPTTYEEYTVYVDSGHAHDEFREFCNRPESGIELSWKDRHDA